MFFGDVFLRLGRALSRDSEGFVLSFGGLCLVFRMMVACGFVEGLSGFKEGRTNSSRAELNTHQLVPNTDMTN